MTPRSLQALAVRLGWLSSAGIFLSLLALTDIYHREADVSLEWNIVRVAFVASIAFHVAGLAALKRLQP